MNPVFPQNRYIYCQNPIRRGLLDRTFWLTRQMEALKIMCWVILTSLRNWPLPGLLDNHVGSLHRWRLSDGLAYTALRNRPKPDIGFVFEWSVLTLPETAMVWLTPPIDVFGTVDRSQTRVLGSSIFACFSKTHLLRSGKGTSWLSHPIMRFEKEARREDVRNQGNSICDHPTVRVVTEVDSSASAIFTCGLWESVELESFYYQK